MRLLKFFFLYFTLIFLNSVIIASEREGFGLAIQGGSYKPVYDDNELKLIMTEPCYLNC